MESVRAPAAKKRTKLGLSEEEKGRRMGKISGELGVLMLSTRGSVIAWSLKSRASDDRGWTRRRERGRKNVRCTCLYLFCIISAALPRVTAEAGRFYSRTSFFLLSQDLPRRDSL